MLLMMRKILGRFKDEANKTVTEFKLAALRQILEGAHATYNSLTAKKAADLISREEEARRALAAWEIYISGCCRFNGYKVFFRDCAGRLLGRYCGSVVDVKKKKAWLIVMGDYGNALLPYKENSMVKVEEGDDELTFVLSPLFRL